MDTILQINVLDTDMKEPAQTFFLHWSLLTKYSGFFSALHSAKDTTELVVKCWNGASTFRIFASYVYLLPCLPKKMDTKTFLAVYALMDQFDIMGNAYFETEFLTRLEECSASGAHWIEFLRDLDHVMAAHPNLHRVIFFKTQRTRKQPFAETLQKLDNKVCTVEVGRLHLLTNPVVQLQMFAGFFTTRLKLSFVSDLHAVWDHPDARRILLAARVRETVLEMDKATGIETATNDRKDIKNEPPASLLATKGKISSREFLQRLSARPKNAVFHAYRTQKTTQLVQRSLLALEAQYAPLRTAGESTKQAKPRSTVLDTFFAVQEYAMLTQQNQHTQKRAKEAQEGKEAKEAKETNESETLQINYPWTIHLLLMEEWCIRNMLTSVKWDHFLISVMSDVELLSKPERLLIVRHGPFVNQLSRELVLRCLESKNAASAFLFLVEGHRKTKYGENKSLQDKWVIISCAEQTSSYLQLVKCLISLMNTFSSSERYAYFVALIGDCCNFASCAPSKQDMPNYLKDQWQAVALLLKWLDPGPVGWTHYLTMSDIWPMLKRHLFTQTKAVAQLIKPDSHEEPSSSSSKKTEELPRKHDMASKKEGDVILVAVHWLSGKTLAKPQWGWAIGVLVSDPVITKEQNSTQFSAEVQIVGAQDEILLVQPWAWTEFSVDHWTVIEHAAWYVNTPKPVLPRMGYNYDFDLMMKPKPPRELL